MDIVKVAVESSGRRRVWHKVGSQTHETILSEDHPLLQGWVGEIEAAPVVMDNSPVSPWQLRRAIKASGLSASVASLLGSNEDFKEAWDSANCFERDHPFVEAAQVGLGLTDAQVDQLFALARTFR